VSKGYKPAPIDPRYPHTLGGATGAAAGAAAGAAVAGHVAATDPHTGYQKEAEKGIASGYASLGADGLVPQDQLGSGTQDGTRFLRDDGTWQLAGIGVTLTGTPGAGDVIVATSASAAHWRSLATAFVTVSNGAGGFELVFEADGSLIVEP